MISIKNILLPVDFSEPCFEATKYAVELAEKFDATLHLLHVIVDPVVYLPMFESNPLPSHEEFESYAQQQLDAWIADQDKSRCTTETHWIHGSPFVEIVKFARGTETDLIVIGTHGRGPVTHLLMGSVAERVVRKANCPVLTVRPKGHQFVTP